MDEHLMKAGAISWSELMTNDLNAAKDFYGKLFGWELERAPSEEMEYVVAKSDGREIAGMMAEHETERRLMKGLSDNLLGGIAGEPLSVREFVRREIANLTRKLLALARGNDVSRRLMTVPGIGSINALAFCAAIASSNPVVSTSRPFSRNASCVKSSGKP